MNKTDILVKPLLCFLVIVLFKNSLAQTNIINKTLLVPDSSVLYLGITNSIEIVNNKNPFFEIRSASRNLSSTRNSYLFDLRPTHLGWDTVFILDGNEILFQKAFKIVALPSIEAKLGTLRVEEATQEEIYINGWLVLTIPNCKCTPSYVVSSFQIEFEGDDVSDEVIEIEGDRVNTKARKIIKKLKSGDVVYFENIIAKNEDGRSIEVPGFSITVK
jgi:GldM C-terminal domain